MTASVLREARGHVAALIGTTERRVRAIWNGEARAVRADEMDALREAVARKKTANVTDHASRLEAAARALETIDPDFHRSEIDRLRHVAGTLRRANAQALT